MPESISATTQVRPLPQPRAASQHLFVLALDVMPGEKPEAMSSAVAGFSATQRIWVPGQARTTARRGAAAEMAYYVYILASRRHGTLYVGVTNDLIRRVQEHKERLHRGFTARYGVTRLVYFEIFDDPLTAIAREKQIKGWKREFKLNVIERDNPNWDDLYAGLF